MGAKAALVAFGDVRDEVYAQGGPAADADAPDGSLVPVTESP
jgi:hypothetical protein